jgi:hypothetical protein
LFMAATLPPARLDEPLPITNFLGGVRIAPVQNRSFEQWQSSKTKPFPVRIPH